MSATTFGTIMSCVPSALVQNFNLFWIKGGKSLPD